MRLHKGYTTSDLHLLSNRSSAERLMPEIHRAATEGDLLILNGDIFDFQWSVYPDLGQSLNSAEHWIRRLVSRHRDCRFVFIMGNHDSLPAYGDLLDALAESHDNLAWEPFHLRLGSSVFLHGDVGSSSHCPEALATYRQRWHGPRRRAWLHAAYLACTRLGIPRLIHECTPVRRYATDVVAYLKTEMGAGFTELTDVYFGHSHKPVTDYEWKGLRFHNTGATIHRVRCRLQTFTYDPAELHRVLDPSVTTGRARKATRL